MSILQWLRDIAAPYLGRDNAHRTGAGERLRERRYRIQSAASAFSKINFLPWLDEATGDSDTRREAYRKMMIDDAVKGAVCSKLFAVASLDPAVLPADPDNKLDRKAAEFIQSALERMAGGIRGTVEDVIYPLIVDGYVTNEKVYGELGRGKYARKWTVQRLRPLFPRDYTLELDEFGQWVRVIGQGQNTGKEWDKRLFTYLKIMPLYDNPRGQSDLAASYRPFFLKDTLWKIRKVYLEYFASGPYLVGKYGNADSDKSPLEAALKLAKGASWVTIPETAQIQVLDLAMKSTSDFADAIEKLDREIVNGISGAILQSMEGAKTGSYNQGLLHATTSDLRVWYLAEVLSSLFNDQVIPDLCDLNFVGLTDYPRVTFGGVNDADLKASLELDMGLATLIPLSSSELYAKYRRKPPTDPGDAIGGKPSAPPPNYPPPAPGGQTFSEWDESFAEGPWQPPSGRRKSWRRGVPGDYEYRDEQPSRLTGKERDKLKAEWEALKPRVVTADGRPRTRGVSPDDQQKHRQIIAAMNGHERALAYMRLADVRAEQSGKEHHDSFGRPTNDLTPIVRLWMHRVRQELEAGHKLPAGVMRDYETAQRQHYGESFAEARIAKTLSAVTKAAERHGIEVLANIAHAAVARRMQHPAPSASLFTDEERQRLADALAATLATARLAGRATMRAMAERKKRVVVHGEPVEYQVRFALEPVGVDADGTIRPITESGWLEKFDDTNPPNLFAPEKALEYFKGLHPKLGELPPERFGTLMQREAFTLAVATEEVLLVKVQEAIVQFLQGVPPGEPYPEPTAKVIDKILIDAGVGRKGPAYAEMVFRTNAHDAYITGSEAERMDPDVLPVFPVWRWDSIDDERTRDTHRARYHKYYPGVVSFQAVRGSKPEDVINCRCVPTAIYIDDWEELQASGAKVETTW